MPPKIRNNSHTDRLLKTSMELLFKGSMESHNKRKIKESLLLQDRLFQLIDMKIKTTECVYLRFAQCT
jgi:hypothetical protein